MSKNVLICHRPILSPMVRVLAGYIYQLIFCLAKTLSSAESIKSVQFQTRYIFVAKLSTALRVLQLPDKKLIQAKDHRLMERQFKVNKVNQMVAPYFKHYKIKRQLNLNRVRRQSSE